MDNTKKQTEIEIKLKLDAFADYLKLLGCLGSMDFEERLKNCFFETSERHLSAAGYALRVRATDKTGLITLKGMGAIIGSAAVREEIETTIDRSLAIDLIDLKHDLLSIDCEPVSLAKKHIGSAAVEPLLRFETIRQHKSYQIRDSVYEFEVDKTEFSDGLTDYELEVELADQSLIEQAEIDLRRLFESLDIPFEIQTKSKFARALAAAEN